MPRNTFFTRSFYAPKGGKKVVFKDHPGAELVWKAGTQTNGTGFIHAVGFSGRRQKPDFNLSFRSPEAMEKHVARWIAELDRVKAEKKERKADRNQPHAVEIGTVFAASWGYEQTNVDFYEVVQLVGKNTVVIRKVAQETREDGVMQGQTVPHPGCYTSEPMRKRVAVMGQAATDSKYRHAITVDSVRTAFEWDGRPMRTSWYH